MKTLSIADEYEVSGSGAGADLVEIAGGVAMTAGGAAATAAAAVATPFTGVAAVGVVAGTAVTATGIGVIVVGFDHLAGDFAGYF